MSGPVRKGLIDIHAVFGDWDAHSALLNRARLKLAALLAEKILMFYSLEEFTPALVILMPQK